MNIQPNINFTARIKINDVKELVGTSVHLSPYLSSGSSGVGSTAAGTLGTTASQVAGSTSDVLGTAFSLKATGIDSFGIAPSVLDSAAPHITQRTLISGQNHPSAVGTFFSSLGSFAQSLVKTTSKNVKDPS